MLELERKSDGVTLRGNEYQLSFKAADPSRAQLQVRGTMAAELFVPSTCDADGEGDEVAGLAPAVVRQGEGEIEVSIGGNSRLWGEVSYHFRGTAEGLSHYVRREGSRSPDTLRFFHGGKGKAAGQCSRGNWRRVFDPEPNARRKHYFEPDERATIGVSSDPQYYSGNWLFTPGPLCYAFALADGGWLGAGVKARPGTCDFDHFEYCGTPDGFGLALHYGRHVQTSGTWNSPEIVLLAADDEYAVLARYCQWLKSKELPTARSTQYDWWWEPIFCGWGEQVGLEQRKSFTEVPPVAAADHATQANYERFLASLAEHDLAPGTIVIDDQWQSEYGLNTPDPAKWPDMPGFIARQHAAGRKVLLWLRAWHHGGVPKAECLLDDNGEPLAVDPSNPAYDTRLRAQVRRMLIDLGADGFKIDFTHCLPTELGVRSAGGIWGMELLKRLLYVIYDEAKQAKPDALIMAHTANPYFSDVVDMLRLNDIANVVGQPRYLDSMIVRAKVARIVSPHWLIDTDNWPSPNRAAWQEYCRAQPGLGVPSLYYVTRIYHLGADGAVTDEALDTADYRALAALWQDYRAKRARRDV